MSIARHTIAARQMAAELALKEIRAAYDGTLLLLKGPEVASWYPDPTDRPFADLDLLCDEPERLESVLLASGYELAGEPPSDHSRSWWDDHHHLQPLERTTLGVFVEIHRSPGWLAGMTPPTLDQLIRNAVPSRVGIEGLLTLDPPAHAVFLAVHSWRTRPFHRRQDLEDIRLLLDSPSTVSDAGLIARAWGVSRIWGYYRNAIAASDGQERTRPMVWLLGGGPRSRTRSVRSDYLSQQLGRLLVDHPVEHRREIARSIQRDLRPLGGEPYHRKVARMLRTVLHA